jgi:F0F1-type ATP synthase assembly protein I
MRSGSPRTSGWEGVGIAWSITSTLLASFLVLGGLGYLGDKLLDTGKVLTAIGFVLGAGFGVYAVYLQYGKGERDDR